VDLLQVQFDSLLRKRRGRVNDKLITIQVQCCCRLHLHCIVACQNKDSRMFIKTLELTSAGR
jgi:hypothetical protein